MTQDLETIVRRKRDEAAVVWAEMTALLVEAGLEEPEDDEDPAKTGRDAGGEDDPPADDLPPPRAARAIPAAQANGVHAGAALKPVATAVPVAKAAAAKAMDPRRLRSCEKIAKVLKTGPVESINDLARRMDTTAINSVSANLKDNPEWFAKGSAGWHLTAEGVKVLLAHGG